MDMMLDKQVYLLARTMAVADSDDSADFNNDVVDFGRVKKSDKPFSFFIFLCESNKYVKNIYYSQSNQVKIQLKFLKQDCRVLDFY